MATYKSAAQVLEKVLGKKGSVKSLVITSHFPNKRKLYALVCETLKYRTVIEDILEQTQFEKHERKVRHAYALVLVYDFLFGAGLQCGGALKVSVMRNKSSLQSALARLKIKAGVSRNEDLLPKKVRDSASLPRYVRVNTIRTTVEEVVQHFVQDGFSVVPSDDPNWAKQSGPVQKMFRHDDHLEDVLVFPATTDLHDHTLYTSGHILLQDKASCFPAHVVSPAAGSHVIDACAAPGNKTSHVASLMRNEGRIFAFDISARRLKILEKMMTTAGVTCVTTKNCSFLDVSPYDPQYSKVESILVDPSCSGSGIVSRMDALVDSETELEEQEKRLTSLAKFQLSALQHALSFPAVRRVVYSTCSIHQEENEDVVRKALANNDQFELSHALPTWPHRGDAVFPEAVKCVRASPEQDATNGFFVALFVRKNETKQGNAQGQTQGQTKGQTQKHIRGQIQGQTKGHKVPDVASTSEVTRAIVTSPIDTSSARKRKRNKRKAKARSMPLDALSTAPLAVVPPFVALSKKGKRKKKRKNSGKTTEVVEA